MRSGNEWLADKLESTAQKIELEGLPDKVFFVPFWRQVQLRRCSSEVLTAVFIDFQLKGFELRGGDEIRKASMVFVLPAPLIESAISSD